MSVDTENEIFERPNWHISDRFPEPNPKLCRSKSVLEVRDSRRFMSCLCKYMNDIWRMSCVVNTVRTICPNWTDASSVILNMMSQSSRMIGIF